MSEIVFTTGFKTSSHAGPVEEHSLKTEGFEMDSNPQNQIKNLQTTLASLNQQIIILQEALQERDQQIVSLQNQLDQGEQPQEKTDETVTIVGALINLYNYIFLPGKVA